MSILRTIFMVACVSTIMTTSTFAANSATNNLSLYLDASQFAQEQHRINPQVNVDQETLAYLYYVDHPNENSSACGQCILIDGSHGRMLFGPRPRCVPCS